MAIENLDKIVLENGKKDPKENLVYRLQNIANHPTLSRIKNPVTLVKKEGSKEGQRDLVIYKGGFYKELDGEKISRLACVQNDADSYLRVIKEYELSDKDIDKLEEKLDELYESQSKSD